MMDTRTPYSQQQARLAMRAAAEQVFDHYVSGVGWLVPGRVELIEHDIDPTYKLLVWCTNPTPRLVHPGPGLLDDFLKLERAAPERILAFARRWGPFWLCTEHQLPYQHNLQCDPAIADIFPVDNAGGDDDLDEDDALDVDDDGAPDEADENGEDADYEDEEILDWFEEQLTTWRVLSRQARATVRLARQLHNGQRGRLEDWRALPFLPGVLHRMIMLVRPGPFDTTDQFPTWDDLHEDETPAQREARIEELRARLRADPRQRPPGPRRTLEEQAAEKERLFQAWAMRRLDRSLEFQRQVLGDVLNYWLELADVRPRLDWSRDQPLMELGGNGLLGALAVQLLFECSRTDGLAVCTSCGTPFLPAFRRPRRDRNAYCSDCGLKAAQRDAAARYRQTEKYKATYERWRRTRD